MAWQRGSSRLASETLPASESRGLGIRWIAPRAAVGLLHQLLTASRGTCARFPPSRALPPDEATARRFADGLGYA